jgi:hypothetical protein
MNIQFITGTKKQHPELYNPEMLFVCYLEIKKGSGFNKFTSLFLY